MKPFGYIEGRIHQCKDEDFKGGAFKVSEAQQIIDNEQYKGLPIYYDHDYEKDIIGRIVKAWIDDEKYFCIGANIFNSNLAKDVMLKIRNNEYNHFSIGYNHSQPDSDGNVLCKKIIEASVTPDPMYNDCMISVRCSKKEKKDLYKDYKIPFSSISSLVLNSNKTMSEEVEQNTQPEVTNTPEESNTDQINQDVEMKEAEAAKEQYLNEKLAKGGNEYAKQKIIKTTSELDKLKAELEEAKKIQQLNDAERREFEALRKNEAATLEKYKAKQEKKASEIYNVLSNKDIIDKESKNDKTFIHEMMTSREGVKVAEIVTKLVDAMSKDSDVIQGFEEQLKKNNEERDAKIQALEKENQELLSKLKNNPYSDYAPNQIMVQNHRNNLKALGSLYDSEDEDEIKVKEQPKQVLVTNNNANKKRKINEVDEDPFAQVSDEWTRMQMKNTDPTLFKQLQSFGRVNIFDLPAYKNLN